MLVWRISTSCTCLKQNCKYISRLSLPLRGRRKFRFQELELDLYEESNGGGREMKIAGIQTRTIEEREKIWFQSGVITALQNPKKVTQKSLPSPRNTTIGVHVAPLEGYGAESKLGVI